MNTLRHKRVMTVLRLPSRHVIRQGWGWALPAPKAASCPLALVSCKNVTVWVAYWVLSMVLKIQRCTGQTRSLPSRNGPS